MTMILNKCVRERCIQLIPFLLSTVFFVSSESPTKQPNIVFVVVQDLGWDDVGFHGSTQVPTPNMDALAMSGVILNSYYVSPNSFATKAEIMTGKYAAKIGLQHGVLHNQQPLGVPSDVKILPEYLHDLGYATHAIGKWGLGFSKSSMLPRNRGFDSFYGMLTSSAADYFTHEAVDAGTKGHDLWRNGEVVRNESGSYTTELFTREAVSVINNHNTEHPMFLYVSHQAVQASSSPTQPMQVPPGYLDRVSHVTDERRRRYAAMVSAVDDSLFNITYALNEKTMLENTVIVVTSDSGGAVGGMDSNAGSNFPLRGGKMTVWEGGLRAVGFVYSELLQNDERVSNELMHSSDWLPTLVHLAGGEDVLPTPGSVDGLNIWNTISASEMSPRFEILHQLDPMMSNVCALRVGDYKVVMNQDIGYYGDWYPRTDEATEEGKPAMNSPMSDVILHNSTIRCDKGFQHPYLEVHAPVCDPTHHPCLYNVRWDPCEFHNLAQFMPNSLKVLLDRVYAYQRQVHAPTYPPFDLTSDPALHGGQWRPWRNASQGPAATQIFSAVTTSKEVTIAFEAVAQTPPPVVNLSRGAEPLAIDSVPLQPAVEPAPYLPLSALDAGHGSYGYLPAPQKVTGLNAGGQGSYGYVPKALTSTVNANEAGHGSYGFVPAALQASSNVSYAVQDQQPQPGEITSLKPEVTPQQTYGAFLVGHIVKDVDRHTKDNAKNRRVDPNSHLLDVNSQQAISTTGIDPSGKNSSGSWNAGTPQSPPLYSAQNTPPSSPNSQANLLSNNKGSSGTKMGGKTSAGGGSESWSGVGGGSNDQTSGPSSALQTANSPNNPNSNIAAEGPLLAIPATNQATIFPETSVGNPTKPSGQSSDGIDKNFNNDFKKNLNMVAGQMNANVGSSTNAGSYSYSSAGGSGGAEAGSNTGNRDEQYPASSLNEVPSLGQSQNQPSSPSTLPAEQQEQSAHPKSLPVIESPGYKHDGFKPLTLNEVRDDQANDKEHVFEQAGADGKVSVKGMNNNYDGYVNSVARAGNKVQQQKSTFKDDKQQSTVKQGVGPIPASMKPALPTDDKKADSKDIVRGAPPESLPNATGAMVNLDQTDGVANQPVSTQTDKKSPFQQMFNILDETVSTLRDIPIFSLPNTQVRTAKESNEQPLIPEFLKALENKLETKTGNSTLNPEPRPGHTDTVREHPLPNNIIAVEPRPISSAQSIKSVSPMNSSTSARDQQPINTKSQLNTAANTSPITTQPQSTARTANPQQREDIQKLGLGTNAGSVTGSESEAKAGGESGSEGALSSPYAHIALDNIADAGPGGQKGASSNVQLQTGGLKKGETIKNKIKDKNEPPILNKPQMPVFDKPVAYKPDQPNSKTKAGAGAGAGSESLSEAAGGGASGGASGAEAKSFVPKANVVAPVKLPANISHVTTKSTVVKPVPEQVVSLNAVASNANKLDPPAVKPTEARPFVSVSDLISDWDSKMATPCDGRDCIASNGQTDPTTAATSNPGSTLATVSMADTAPVTTIETPTISNVAKNDTAAEQPPTNATSPPQPNMMKTSDLEHDAALANITLIDPLLQNNTIDTEATVGGTEATSNSSHQIAAGVGRNRSHSLHNFYGHIRVDKYKNYFVKGTASEDESLIRGMVTNVGNAAALRHPISQPIKLSNNVRKHSIGFNAKVPVDIAHHVEPAAEMVLMRPSKLKFKERSKIERIPEKNRFEHPKKKASEASIKKMFDMISDKSKRKFIAGSDHERDAAALAKTNIAISGGVKSNGAQSSSNELSNAPSKPVQGRLIEAKQESGEKVELAATGTAGNNAVDATAVSRNKPSNANGDLGSIVTLVGPKIGDAQATSPLKSPPFPPTSEKVDASVAAPAAKKAQVASAEVRNKQDAIANPIGHGAHNGPANSMIVSSVIVVIVASFIVVGMMVIAVVAVVARHCRKKNGPDTS